MSGEHMSVFRESFKTYVAAMDTMTNNNATLRQNIFEGSCEKAKCLALEVAFKAAMFENRALLNDLQSATNIIKEDGQSENESALMETTEQAKLEKNIGCLRSQKSKLKVLHQGLHSELTEEEALKERCVQLNAEKDRIQEENYAILDECVELWRKIGQRKTGPEEVRKLEQEVETLKVRNREAQEEYEELKSKLLQEDTDERCVLLKSEIDCIRRQNEEMYKSCAELRDRVLSQGAVQEECRKREEELATLKVRNREAQEEYEELKSKLLQEDTDQRCGLLKSEIDCICRQNEEMYKSCAELRDRVLSQGAVQEECRKREEELATLKVENRKMQEEYEELKSIYPLKDIDERYVLLQSTVDQLCREKKALCLSCAELRDQEWSRERVQEECRELEAEIETFKVQNSQLREEFEQLKTKLYHEDIEARHVQLQLERDSRCQDLIQMRDETFNMMWRLAQESCWEKKCEAIELSKDALEREYKFLEQHLQTLIKTNKVKAAKDSIYKDKVKRIQELKTSIDWKEQAIDSMQKDIVNLKVKSESYKHIDKEEADLEAINKELYKKTLKLKKELQKLQESDVEIQKVTSDTDKLRRQNCNLYRNLMMLEDRIAQTGLFKTRLKMLKAEEKALKGIQDNLQKEIWALGLGDKKGLFDWYKAEYKRHEEQIKELRDRNDELRLRHEELCIAVYTQEVLEFLNSNRKTEIEDMNLLNDKTMLDIRRLELLKNLHVGIPNNR